MSEVCGLLGKGKLVSKVLLGSPHVCSVCSDKLGR